MLEIEAIYAQRSNVQDRTMKALDEVKKGLVDLQQCINEAVLYAEQSSYEQLQVMGAKYRDDPEAAAKAFNEVLHDTLIELSKPVRKMLRLKKISFRK